MIKTKTKKVRFDTLTPAMAWILYRLEHFHRVLMKNGPTNLVITSMNDGEHMHNSRHYIDEAIDIRTHNFPNLESKIDFCYRFNDMLGPKFTVILENQGLPTEHIHVQVKKGLTFHGVEV